jgi:alpha-glucosidase
MSSTQDLLWWQRGIIYQVYPRSFKDSNGDGIGDLQGIIDKLDYLNDGTENSLGIDAIWISPFYPSPMADFGYDISDYCAVDPIFGSQETFDWLVQEAHKRNIRVIVDYVPNHTSNQHPWFIESRSSRDNPKRNWYFWRDRKLDGNLPNNWGSMFGGSVWEWDDKTRQYYFHQFAKEQPDLNWRNPEVYKAMMDVLRFWLGRGVDGFRMDVVYFILKHPDLPDQPENLAANISLPANDLYSRQQHIYDHDYSGVLDIIHDFRRVMDEYGETCGIGELWLDLPRWIRYYGENGKGLHLPFNFRLIGLPFDATLMRNSVAELEAALPSYGWPNYVLGSHDVHRIASRYGLVQARVAAMMLLTLRGTPTLYNGDELGLENGAISPDKIQDPQGKILGPERNRDVCRTPIQWDSSSHAGFSSAEPWLPVSDDYQMRNVAAESAAPTSILNLYRKLIWYRRRTPALYGGKYEALNSSEGTFVYLRRQGDEKRLIALNFTDKDQQIDMPSAGQIAISTHLDRVETLQSHSLTLRPYEGVIVELS